MSVGRGRTGDMQTPRPDLPQHDTQQWRPPVGLPLLPPLPQLPGRRRRPLPDAVAVRRCPVPAWAPPFDGLPGPAQASISGPGPGQGQGGPQRARQGPSEPGEVPAEPRAGADGPRASNSGASRSGAATSRPGPTSKPGPARRPEPDGKAGPGDGTRQPPTQDGWAGAWPSQFAQVLAETLVGSRPAQQVRPWTTEQARKRIRQLGPMLQASQRPRVRRVLTSQPRPDVVEMTVIIGIGPRTRAMAVRLERAEPDCTGPDGIGSGRTDGESQSRRWLCTAIEAA